MKRNPTKKRLAAACAILGALLLALGSASLFAAPQKNDSAAASVTASDRTELARAWAEGWKTRDGSLRSANMSKEMRNAFRASQLNDTGDANSTVIRGSSPWVTDYAVNPDGKSVRIEYAYTDSSAARYVSSERLSFSAENGRTVVSGCENVQELSPITGAASR